MMEPYISPRHSPRHSSSVRYERASPNRSPSPRRCGPSINIVNQRPDYLGVCYSDQPPAPLAQSSTPTVTIGASSSPISPSSSIMFNENNSAITHRRNTLPKHGQAQFLSPTDVFTRARSNSYYNRSPSRRRRSFKDNSSKSPTKVKDEDSWESYAANKVNRKMSLPASEPISPGSQTKFVNVVIVGDSNVGKYTLIRHLVDADSNPASSIDKSIPIHRLTFPLFDNFIEIVFQHYQNVDKIIDTARDNGYMVSDYSQLNGHHFEINYRIRISKCDHFLVS